MEATTLIFFCKHVKEGRQKGIPANMVVSHSSSLLKKVGGLLDESALATQTLPKKVGGLLDERAPATQTLLCLLSSADPYKIG